VPPLPQNPTQLSAGAPDGGKQLDLLLNSAIDMANDEFRRSERLDAKARHLLITAGGLFTIGMATTAGVLNALLAEDKVAGWVYPVLGGTALGSIVALLIAFAWSQEVGKVQQTDALDPDTLDEYIPFAEKGVEAVGKNLVSTYAQILRARRSNNAQRVGALKKLTIACGVAYVSSMAQLGAVFIALIFK
jgi:hypothetical protein